MTGFPSTHQLDPARGEIVLTKDVVIDASEYHGGIILDGGKGMNRIFSVPADRKVTLAGLTLTGGNGSGAVRSGTGGAIYNDGVLTLSRCTLAGNSALSLGLFSSGGAISNSGALMLADCMLSNNSSGSGGAISSSEYAFLQRCSLTGNSAYGGGAIEAVGTLVLENSTLTGNSPQLGAAIFAENTLRLTHCTVTANHSLLEGGAVSLDDAEATFTNSIVALNTPSGPGADIYVDEESSGTHVTRLGTNIIPFYLSRAGSTDSGPPALSSDPRLAPLGNYGGFTPTMPPLAGSAAIDAVPVGSTPAGPFIDQRGFSRPVDGDGDGIARADCGAVESVVSWVTTIADEFDTPSGPSVSLREAIRDAQNHITIAFSPSLFTPSAPLLVLDPSKGELRVDKNLIIDGKGPGKGVTVDGGPGTNRIFFIPHEGNVTLAGLTLTGGNASGAGFSGWGGAIYNTGRLTLIGCTLTGNANASGLGGAIYSDGTLSLTRCLLTGNSSKASGGALFNEGPAQLMECTFSGNHSGTVAGAIKNNNSDLSLTACTFYSNSATRQEGVTIYDEEGTTDMKNCTLSAGGPGSAIYAYKSILRLTHCTISGQSDGAIAGLLAELTLSNSIVAPNPQPGSLPLQSREFVGFSSVLFAGANLVQSPVEAGVISGPAPLSAAALLAPVGDYGGPTWTMPPLVSSPAVDAVPVASEVAGLATDQRGVGRILDGDGNFLARPDLGAVELVVSWVTTEVDKLDPSSSRYISLREAVRDAPNHSTIAFRTDGFFLGIPRIVLDPVLGEIVLSRNVTIDGGKIAGGVTIDGGPGSNRIFSASARQSVLFTGLRLTGGGGRGGVSGDGGAIDAHHFSRVTLVDCTLTGNSAESSGGAIKSEGTLRLERCILTGNTAGNNGGAIVNDGSSTMMGCTLTGNTAGLSGGALHAEGPLTLIQCMLGGNSADEGGAINSDSGRHLTLAHSTLGGNSARTGGAIATQRSPENLRLTHCTLASNAATDSGGAIHFINGVLTMTNCIVSSNTAPDGAGKDIYAAGGEVIRTGANIIQSVSKGGATESGPAAILADPLLAPLGDYGGPTHSMALKAASPALNASGDSTAASDQRGFPIIGLPDLGAYEAGTPPNFQTWSLETTGGSLDFVADPDGDGAPNGIEYALRSHPLTADGSGLSAPLPASRGPGSPSALVLAFPWLPAATDLQYVLQRSTGLTDPNGWTAALIITRPTSFTHGVGVTSNISDLNGGTIYVYDTNLGAPVAFWRLVVQRVP